MKTALLVIDAQNVYTNATSSLYCKQAKKTLSNINRLIKRFERDGNPVLFVRHIHALDGSDLGRMFDFAGPVDEFNFKDGTEEVEFSETLSIPEHSTPLVKTRYSAFAGTDLDKILKNMAVGRVVVCGFMTNFCCDSTARDAHDLDYFVDFIVDATGTPGTASMNQAKIRKVVSALLSEGYAEVFDTKVYLEKLPSRAE